jgi:hypothetical protein
MEVPPVNQGQFDARVVQTARGGKTGEASSDNDNPVRHPIVR